MKGTEQRQIIEALGSLREENPQRYRVSLAAAPHEGLNELVGTLNTEIEEGVDFSAQGLAILRSIKWDAIRTWHHGI